jgi:phosphoribosylformimino-5-aminoimidazole carboxamide ribotide isomerase
MEILASIDIRDGRCVNLIQGDFNQETIYFDDPRDAARHFLDEGTDWIHIVDLDAARSGVSTHPQLTAEIIEMAGPVPVQIGGGIRSIDAIRSALNHGAARVVLGTAAVRNPELVSIASAEFPGQIAVGVDARDGKVVIEGWATKSPLETRTVAAQAIGAGASALIHTDVKRDGMLSQPNFKATTELVQAFGDRADVIASGGVHTASDITQLAQLGAAGVIIGRALYTGAVTLPDARRAAEG